MSSVISEPSILVSEKEAAHLLGCCERTVWSMRKDGKIRCVKIGAAVRYSRLEIDRFIEAHSTPLNGNSPERS